MLWKKLKFSGEYLIESPLFQQLRFDKFGTEILKRVNARYKGTLAEIDRNNLASWKDAFLDPWNRPIPNASSFRLSAIDEIARELNSRVILPEELRVLFADERLPKEGDLYYGLGVALDFSKANHELAVKLYDSLPTTLRYLESFPSILVGSKLNKKDRSLFFEYGENSQLKPLKSTCEDRKSSTRINLGIRGFFFDDKGKGISIPGLSDPGSTGRVLLIESKETKSSMDFPKYSQ